MAVDLVGFNVGSSFSLLGSVDALTQPVNLQVLLDSAVQGDTFISISSSDPALLTVTGGGVTVLAGQLRSNVRVSGLQTGTVDLTATLGGTQATALVSVVTAIPSVPENGTAALLAAGGPLLVWIARRRARAASGA